MTERYIQHLPEFRMYNREQELARREREQKESAWEQELLQAMRASDPTGSQHASSEDHKEPANGNTGRVVITRAGLLDADTSTGENRSWQEPKSRNYTSTLTSNVDHTIRTGVISNFVSSNEAGRRHSDQSYKSMYTKVLPFVRKKSEIESCEDDMPQESTNQCKYNVLSKKIYKAAKHGSGCSVNESEHCRSCPKLFTTEQSTSSSNLFPKPESGQDIQGNATCKNLQKTCRVPTSTESLDDSYKCQITNKDSINYFHIQSQSLDNGCQNQGISYNTQTQMSETRSVKEQYQVKEHTVQKDAVSNSIDHNLCQYQGSSTVRYQNLDCSKPCSSKSPLDST